MLAQEDSISQVIEFDAVHETPHEQDPPAVGDHAMRFVCRIRQSFNVKTFSLVRYFDVNPIFCKTTLDMDRFG